MIHADQEAQRLRGSRDWTGLGNILIVFVLGGIGILSGMTIRNNLATMEQLQQISYLSSAVVNTLEGVDAKATQLQAGPSISGKPLFFDPPRTRDDIGILLEARGYKVGAELGVQRGHFSAVTLTSWKSCKTYYLVDIWRHQENYEDFANVPQAEQDKLFIETQNNLQLWKAITRFYRNFTNEAAKLITEPLDYVYVDARHDYCGAMEDIGLYWPKIKSGGIMAGHDYLDAHEANAASGQHWEKCMDGSVHWGAVRGAVNEFFQKLDVPVYVTYRDAPWVSWLVVKP